MASGTRDRPEITFHSGESASQTLKPSNFSGTFRPLRPSYYRIPSQSMGLNSEPDCREGSGFLFPSPAASDTSQANNFMNKRIALLAGMAVGVCGALYLIFNHFNVKSGDNPKLLAAVAGD